MSEPTMDIIVNEGRDRKIYPGTSEVDVKRSLPEYQGGITMTIRVETTRTEPVTPTITVDPELHGGVPSIGGQWPISQILERLAAGFYPHQLLEEYAGLTLADIQLALQAAAWTMKDPSIDWQSIDLMGMTELQKEMQEWQGLSDDAMDQMRDM